MTAQAFSTDFDYAASAELYLACSRHKRGYVKFYRFDTAADAIRFAVEDTPSPALLGIALEVHDARYEGQQIRQLYDSCFYPLLRRNTDQS